MTRKTTQAPQAQTETGQGKAIAAPADPGPPPSFPAPPRGVWPFGIERIRNAGRERNREAVLAISTLRLAPEISRYKAEVLEWLDAMDAYEDALP